MLGRKIGSRYDGEIDGPRRWWSIDEPEPHLGEAIMVPDLAGWRRERLAVRNPWFNRSVPLRRAHQTGCRRGSDRTHRRDATSGGVTELTLMQQAK